MKRIIAVVSVVKPDAQTEHYRYDIAGQTGEVEGKQTNEAPIKVLLTLHPDIEEVIAIVTDAAAQEREHLGGLSSYGYLEQHIRAEFPWVSFFPIPSGDTLDFNGTLLPEILGRVDSNNVIYLETTGGFRDTVTDLMQLSQVLTYQGTRVERAVYSNFHARPKQVEDVPHSYRSFDLISGLNEFQRYGSVESLKRYFSPFEEQPREVRELISSMENVFDAISMCRIDALDRYARRFRMRLQAIQEPESPAGQDPLLRMMLPIFQEKFHTLESTYYHLEWCLNNRLFQQALTIYTDCVPKYLMKKGYLTVTMNADNYLNWTDDEVDNSRGAINSITDSEYRKRPEYCQLNFLLWLSRRNGTRTNGDPMGVTIDTFSTVLRSTPYRLHPALKLDEVQNVLRDFLFAQTLRNMVNHASGGAPIKQGRKRYLESWSYPTSVRSLEEVRDALTAALGHLKTLAERTGQEV